MLFEVKKYCSARLTNLCHSLDDQRDRTKSPVKTEEEQYPHNNHKRTESEKTENALQKLVVMHFVMVFQVTCATFKVGICTDLDQYRQSNKRRRNEVSIGPKFD